MVEGASLRVVLFSVEPRLASLTIPLLASLGHRVVGIVTAPGPRSRRTDSYRAVMALARPGLDVIVSNYPDRWAAMIAPLRPDLVMVAGFNWIIPADVLAVPRLGAINGHDGLLPRYRGMNATGWALRNGETRVGLTVHRVTPRLDDGPILAQESLTLGEDDDIDAIRAWRATSMPRLIAAALARVVAGDPGEPQREEEAFTTPGRFEEAWRWIDWAQPAEQIRRQVRSWIGTRDEPAGALARLGGEPIRITKVALAPDGARGAAPPGTVLRREDGAPVVRCGEGAVRLVAYRAESMPAAVN